VTLAQVEALYKANIQIGHLEALEAVYVHGYYDGAGTSLSATTPLANVLVTRTNPTTILTFKKPDLR
jgi:hypothetical protein